MKTLSTELFAALTGVTPQAAREAFRKASAGKTWRGHDLPVIVLPGQRGGAGGVVWGLVLDRCSPDLKALIGETEAPVETVLEEAFQSIGEERFRVQSEKLGIIQPILATSKQSKERAEAFRAVARDKHMLRSTLTIVAEPTLRDWVRAFEGKGTAGLLPTERGDKGKPKVLMSRKWDGAIDLPGDVQAEIARQIETKARSMIANDGTSEREVVRLCEIELRRACVAAGSQLGKARLSAVCRLSRRWVQRFHHYRLVHMQRKDHKAWQDTCVPRIGRALHPRPMGLLIGDVHYVDILVEEGKEPVRARLIAWMDASSMYAWVTPVFLGKGRGVTPARRR